MNNVDKEYFRLLQTILDNGRVKHNRTGVDTIGVFGEQAKFKVSFDEFPILTTKKVWFKGIVHELLWFLKGDTNIKYLVDNDVHIWDSWAYARYKKLPVNSKPCSPEYCDNNMLLCEYSQKEFIERIRIDDEFAEKYGDLGEGTYGGMWRDFPHFKKTYDAGNCGGVGDEYEADGVDQIKKVIDKLKTNPDDRRMIVSAWHPYWVDYCSLPPCHCLFHFNTEELTFEERCDIMQRRYPGVSSWDGQGGIGSLEIVAKEPGWLDNGGMGLIKSNPVPKRRLNVLLYQRSLDLPVGGPFNISSYCLMLCMVAHCVNMEPGVFTWSTGDTHIYENQLPMIKEQLARTPKTLPKLWLNPEVKDIFSFKYDDIKLIGYDPHPTIKMPVAV